MLEAFGQRKAMVKPLALLVALVASLTLAGTAAPAATPTNFRVTRTVPADDIIGGGGESISGSTTGAFPFVGQATMSADSFWFIDFVTFQVFAGFDVTFTTKGGDTLELFSGYVPDTTFLSAGTWTVLRGTGRFASYSGSGTFTVSISGTPGIDLTETVTLAGSLRP
jgi:hypothetical protein